MKAIVLAAGEGKRMRSNLPKVLQAVCGRPMLYYVIDAVRGAGAAEAVIVVGHGADTVRAAATAYDTGDIRFAVQAQQLGTGHAVICARAFIAPEDDVLVVYGDSPLITAEGITRLRERHAAEKNGVTIVSTILTDPTGYGRVVADNGQFLRVVEQKDADRDTLTIQEVNTGIYLFNGAALLHALDCLRSDNAASEYYLPDTLEIIKSAGHSVGVYRSDNASEFFGANTNAQLAEVSRLMRLRINTAHMLAGVGMIDPERTYIDHGVAVGAGTVVYPGAILEGGTVVGENCVVGANTRLVNTRLGDHTEAWYSVALDSEVGEFTRLGPFAYLRPGSKIGSHSRIGDFVEIKNATLGDHAGVSHLTYIGDADVGSGVNFGCGTVTVNYDGTQKYRTVVHDNAFIGCNTNLIAPVTVGEGAYIAAGSTITDDVPADGLSIARARQVNLPDRAAAYLKNKD